ncbi:hypothetical protein [uncultured Megasphaera sp.]|uniref:hypothetical protein n=1 Tax=uncultured Megasphaera sp. TaxID=165188 RepID=UPI0025ED92E4|nr:hypothetical protein [uncultured Megasphaera sp.]
MAELITTTAGVHYDDLIGGTNVSIVTQNVAVSGATLARGALLTVTDGTAVATAKGATANAILATPVVAEDTVATVYVKGQFNRESIVIADGDDINSHEAELRNVGIYLTSLKG